MAQYDWRENEAKWQGKWKEWGIHRFDRTSQKKVYSIDNPPRYASGNLHLGHAYGYTVIDFAARYKRLKGFNVFYPLCFDTNGTPVEVRVEKVHGVKATDVPRQQFVKMWQEGMQNDYETCRQTQFLVNQLRSLMYLAGSTQQAVYCMASLRDIIHTYPRAPFKPASAQEKEALRSALERTGVL